LGGVLSGVNPTGVAVKEGQAKFVFERFNAAGDSGLRYAKCF